MSVIHKIACEAEYFDAVISGVKTFEVRKNDRDYKEGDFLELRRSVKGSFGKAEGVFHVRVTYILSDDFRGLAPGYCVMAVVPDVPDAPA